MTRSFALSTFIVAGLAGSAWAGPLNKAFVPRDAQWVVHVDLEAGLNSTLGRFITANQDALDLKDLEKCKEELGIDPFKDIKGVTVYGTSVEREDGVAVIEATAAVDHLIDHARQHDKTFEQTHEGKYTIYSWTEGDETRYGLIRPGDGPNSRIVVVTAEKAKLLDSVRLIEGRGDSLEMVKEGLLAKSPKPGSFIFAAGTNLGDAEAMPFQKAQAVALDLGESKDQIYANLIVVPKDATEAKKLQQIMQGAVAMASMWAASEPDLTEIAGLTEHINFSSEGGQVVVKFDYPTEKLIKALEEAKAADAKGESENEKPRHKKRSKNPHDADGNVQ